MKPNDRLKSVLLLCLGGYRAGAFAVILALMTGAARSARGNAAELSWFQISYSVILLSGTVLYFVLRYREKILPILLFIEYFVVFFHAYVSPNLLFIELIWIPGIIAALALLLPKGAGLVLVPAAGIAGTLLFSYGNIYGISVVIGKHSLPYAIVVMALFVPVTLLSMLLNRLCLKTEETERLYSSLENENKRINEINHAISQRMFNLQNDTTQKERNRLSKEIHDTAGYVFINLIMMLQAAQAVLRKDIPKADKLVGDARDYAEKGINEIRYLLRDIRDYTPVRLSLQNELHDVGESFQKATDVEIAIEYGPWPRTFSKNTDFFFISFMQEALTNALKHGRAGRVSVLCWEEGGRFGMTISDKGSGAKLPLKKGIGITAMEDAAGELGGEITIQSNSGGFRIKAVIPAEGPHQTPRTDVS